MSRTSDSHPLRIAGVAAGPGMIGVSFCPGKTQPDADSGAWARDLAKDVAAIRDWGASDVLTLIEDHEFDALRVRALPDATRAAGMHWWHLPIRDGAAPDHRFEAGWPRVAPALLAELGAGGRIYVHCKGGLGRAGTVAAWLLRQLEPEVSPGAAIERVRAARKGAIETASQVAWLHAGSPGEGLWAVPPATLAAYLATTYRVDSDPLLALRIGERSDAIAALHARAGVSRSVFVTACNPFGQLRDDAWNAAAMRRLQAWLADDGVAALPGLGEPDTSGWSAEPGLLALGVDRACAERLCVAFAQNAVVTIDHDAIPRLLIHPARR